MKIAFITDLFEENMSGVGIYVKAFIQSLLDSTPNLKPYFIDSEKSKVHLLKINHDYESIVVPKNNFFFDRNTFLLNNYANVLKDYDFEYIFNLDGTPHFFPFKQKEVVIIHDLGAFLNPKFSNFSRHLTNILLLKLTLNRASFIIVNSKKTYLEMQNVIKFKDMSKVYVVNVIPFFSKNRTRSISLKSDRSSYFLIIGNKEKRKNTANIISAFLTLKRTKNIPHKLIILGEKMLASKELSNSDIQFTGYVKDEKKFHLLKHATALIYGSSYEGLGLPLLEAAFLNCPIISTTVPAGTEILKNAYIILHSSKPNDIVGAIKYLISIDKHKLTNLKKKAYNNVSNYFSQANLNKEREKIHNIFFHNK